ARFELKQFQRQIATTTIYVTHDQIEAMGLGDRIAVMSKGKVRQIGTPQQVYDYPRSEEHTSELQSREKLVCRLLLEKKTIPTNFSFYLKTSQCLIAPKNIFDCTSHHLQDAR